MLVTAIEPLPYSKRRNRYRVRILDGGTLILYKGEIERFGINEGEEISETVYAALLEEVFIPRARRRAVHLLERQSRTNAELKRKLERSGYPAEAVDKALESLKKYIDDSSYARSYILAKQNTRSRKRICCELLNRGISKEILEAVIQKLEREYGENIFNDREIIRNYINKNRTVKEGYKNQKKADIKIYNYLLRNGFCSEDILRELEPR